jgi:hypothetical protein
MATCAHASLNVAFHFLHHSHLSLLTCICLRSRLFSYDHGHRTSTAHHRTFRDVTPGLCGGGVGKQWTLFIVVGVDVACRQYTECWVLPWKYNLHCCRAAKYLALLLTTISVQYCEFVSLLFGMKNVSYYCNSKLPKTCTWSGTFILKDGRYTFLFFFLSLSPY